MDWESIEKGKNGKEENTMYNKRTRFWIGLFSVLTVLLTIWIGEVQCQEKYPTRPIQIIVPFAPGGGTDFTARIMGSYASKIWGVPVNVVNKPGGNAVPACLEVYGARPDGYTLLADSNPTATALPVAVKDLPFKIMDRTFIAMATITPMVVIVPPGSPSKNMKELETEAKKSPETFTWTSTGGASSQDIAGRQVIKAFGVDVLKTKPVMAPGGAPATQLTAGGHVKMGVATPTSILPAFRAGQVRALGITSETRHPEILDIPTTKELGYPTINTLFFVGISGPPNLPSHIVEKWNKALNEMSKDPAVISVMEKAGNVPFYRNQQQMIEYVIKETQELRELWGLK